MSQDLDKTLWVGNLSEKVTEDILFELFLQAGPLSRISIAKEKDGRQKNFAFVTFEHDVSVPYTINLMDGMQLYGRNLRLQSRPGSIHQQQQQQQQQMAPGPPQRNQMHMGNPYQNKQQAPFNPYGMNRPGIGNQHQPQHMQPQLHKSHTWHGGDLDQLNRDRDGRESRDHDRYSNRDRDRSGSRRKDEDYHEMGRGRRDDYDRSYSREDPRQNSNNSNTKKSTLSYGSDDFDTKRKNVLHKQDQMLNRYRQPEGKSSPQHQPWQRKPYNNRRGRY